ncbi:hypothetical protein BH23CHL5_BH23CHL5_22870 [soil metagenome]
MRCVATAVHQVGAARPQSQDSDLPVVTSPRWLWSDKLHVSRSLSRLMRFAIQEMDPHPYDVCIW